MRTIHCQNCGKIYDYAKEGMCPKCGAYNRPPRREAVDANGTVHHLTNYDYESLAESKGGKVCYEAKECHEGAARKVRRSAPDPVEKFAAKVQSRKTPQKSTRQSKAVLITVLLGVLFSVVTTFIANVSPKREPAWLEPESSVVQAEERAEEIIAESIDCIATDYGWFGITGWHYEDQTWAVSYTSEFDPLEVGEMTAVFQSAIGGEEYTVYLDRASHTSWGSEQSGTLTFMSEYAGDTPLGLILYCNGQTYKLGIEQ